MSYCCLFVSFFVYISKLFTFNTYSPKPLGPLEPNLSWIFIRGYFTKFEFLVLIENLIWLSWPIMGSDSLTFQKSSSQKPLGIFDYDIAEMFIRWFCSSFELLVPIKISRWPPQQFLTYDPLGRWISYLVMYNTHFFTLRNNFVDRYAYKTLEHDPWHFFLKKCWL